MYLSYSKGMKTNKRIILVIAFFVASSVYAADSDSDGINDQWEHYWFGNTTTANAATDYDHDGLSDLNEFLYENPFKLTTINGEYAGTNPTAVDTDGDSMWDGWEVLYGFNPLVKDGYSDRDSDGLVNSNEFNSGTNPSLADTDHDSMPDGWEVNNGLNPTNSLDALLDTDSDGISSSNEFVYGTCPTKFDTDNDGLSDSNEVFHAFNASLYVYIPRIWTNSGHVFTNYWYKLVLTNTVISVSSCPTNSDSDGDGVNDLSEIYAGTDPNNHNDYLAVSCAATREDGTNYFYIKWCTTGNVTNDFRGFTLQTKTNLLSSTWKTWNINDYPFIMGNDGAWAIKPFPIGGGSNIYGFGSMPGSAYTNYFKYSMTNDSPLFARVKMVGWIKNYNP
jgi:hypothetical protein